MNWPDLSMGGYGFFVWGSYIFALILIVWEVVSLKQRKKTLKQQQSAQQQQRSSSVSPSVLTGSANETTS
ncbi:MAG TPA: heme exporter protein CcmD [Pyrinomonadaceae bacterium]|nr:heme exporter protein CcmD [Pyrinomonadaceae bacterium]